MEKMAWNIESEYPSYNSDAYQKDFSSLAALLENFEKAISAIQNSLATSVETGKDPDDSLVEVLQSLLKNKETAMVLSFNLSTYLNCIMSVDSKDETALTKYSELEILSSKVWQSLIPVDKFLQRCSDVFLQKVLNHPELKAAEFLLQYERKMKEKLLSNAEETLLVAMSNPGLHAWGNLYSKLSGNIRCHLKYADRTETVGLAQASAMIKNIDPETRRVAWQAIQGAWAEQKDTAAAILNSLSGWRLEEYKKRSQKNQCTS